MFRNAFRGVMTVAGIVGQRRAGRGLFFVALTGSGRQPTQSAASVALAVGGKAATGRRRWQLAHVCTAGGGRAAATG